MYVQFIAWYRKIIVATMYNTVPYESIQTLAIKTLTIKICMLDLSSETNVTNTKYNKTEV